MFQVNDYSLYLFRDVLSLTECVLQLQQPHSSFLSETSLLIGNPNDYQENVIVLLVQTSHTPDLLLTA